MKRFIVAATLMVSGAALLFGQESPTDLDLYSLVLAPIDLTDATKAMTVFDRDEDGFVSGPEQKRISWKEDIDEYDLNKDRKLTHLEFAIRAAKIRADNGVEQKHVNNAKVFMNRHDKNGNGQLDPNEIANGWPDEPDEFDKNSDGIITLGEMAARFSFMAGYRREMGIEQVDQVTAIRMVRQFDKDKDGKLSGEEQEGAFLPLSPRSFDENDDGGLEIIEVATMLAKYRQGLGLSESDLLQIRILFARFDKDFNGKIADEEFALALQTQPDLKKLDSNGDDQLSYQEAGKMISKERKTAGFSDKHVAEARKLLVRHDANKDLHIDETELAERPAAGELPKSVLAKCDKDKDNRISFLELARYLAKQDSTER